MRFAKILPLALAATLIAATATACSNDPTVNNNGSATNGSNLTFNQVDRVGRPGVKELYLPYASHAAFNSTTPISDTTTGPAIATFVTGTGARSSAIATYVQTLLTPDALVANLDNAAATASYLGWETGGGIAADCNGGAPNAFGGRALNDDVVNVMLGLTFGNLGTSANPNAAAAVSPAIGVSPPADDGKEMNGTAGTPNLTNQNVSCAGKGFTLSQFPYLAEPI